MEAVQSQGGVLAPFYPVLWAAAGVGDGQNSDLRRDDFVNNRVGKAFEQRAVDIRFIRQSFESRKLERVIANSLDSGIDGGQKLEAKPLAPIFIPLGRLPRFLLGRGIDAEVHQIGLETSD